MPETVYSLTQIEDWQSKLHDFAKTPRTRFSKQQAVVALIDVIEEALQLHPYAEVAEKLQEWGLDISSGSLKQYVNAYRREQAGEDNGNSSSTRRKSSAKKSSQKKPTATSKSDRAEKATQHSKSDRAEKATQGGKSERSEKATAPAINAQTDNAARGLQKNRTTSARSASKNSKFLEMDEDL